MDEEPVMEFCPKCGSRLEPKKSKSGKDASLVLACLKCGYKKSEAGMTIEPKSTKVIQHNPQQFVAVIGKEEQKLNTMSTVRVECPKCGNNIAYVWQVQTRGADESSTQFLRCTKCNYTYREYS
ncbi:MAG: transcription factor S [Candidatus Bathyarchaeota archaeon]|nr:transcription factor S [Candidatus Termiticorpusculum sp.]